MMLACALVSGVGDYEVTNDDGTTTPGGPDTGVINNGGNDGSISPNEDASEVIDGPPVVIPPIDEDAGADAAPTRFAYASTSNNEIWQLELSTKTLTRIATTQNCNGGIEELALSRTGAMYASAFTGGALFRVNFNGTIGQCMQISSNSIPFSLTFVAPGVLAPTEMLAGYDPNGNYLRVDPANGQMITIKAGALRDNHRPSGDVAGHGKLGYLSATNNNCKPRDCLLEVDLEKGDEKSRLGDFPEERIFGLAYANGLVYGFADQGQIYVVRPSPFQVLDTINPPNGTNPHWRGATAIEQPP
jgi:hypothetical protein